MISLSNFPKFGEGLNSHPRTLQSLLVSESLRIPSPASLPDWLQAWFGVQGVFQVRQGSLRVGTPSVFPICTPSNKLSACVGCCPKIFL